MPRFTLLVLALSLAARLASATEPASLSVPATCPVVSAAAIPFFRTHGFDVAPSLACPGCLTLHTLKLHDLQGHSLTNVRTVMHRYMSIGREQDIPGAWYVHSHLATTGDLTLSPKAQDCRAQLLFHFSWYATEFLVIVPVDGDAATRPSNLRLEAEYLQALAKAAP